MMLRLISRAGREPVCTRVETRSAMQAALKTGEWDVVIADFSLPQFSGEGALETLKESGLDVPFILVSGTVGEETAVHMMKAGANDYLLKEDLGRLYPAIERELRECSNRLERKKAEDELRRRQIQVSFLAEAGGILGSSLEYKKTIRQAAQVAIPRICDICIVDLTEEEGKLERVIAHSNEAKKTELQNLFQKRHPNAIHTGAPDKLLQEIGSHSSLTVPLAARDRILGSITLMMLESNRSFNDSDFWIAEELARRIASAIDNASLYREAQHAINVREEFLMVASHELKTPITSLKMQLQLVRRKINLQTGAVPTAPELHKTVNFSIAQVDRLTLLIEEMLDASRMESGKLTFNLESVPMIEIIEDVLNRFESELHLNHFQVELDVDPDLMGHWDRARIDQVFINLISNAIKYAPGSKIRIIGRKHEDQATITFQDTGPGVSPEKQKLIFERFERGDQNRNIVGLGLGLYISRQIIEAHGGSIRVQSSPGEGTTFIIELPLTVDIGHKTRGISFSGNASHLHH